MKWRAQVLVGNRIAWTRDYKSLRRARFACWIARWRVDLFTSTTTCAHGCCRVGITWRIGDIAKLEAAGVA